MPTQLWAAGYQVDPGDCATTTLLQDGSAGDTSTGVSHAFDGSAVACFDPMNAEVTAILDHLGMVALSSDTWRVLGRLVIATGAINCTLPPETTLATPSYTLLVEGFNGSSWVALGGGTVFASTFDVSGGFGPMTNIRYLRASLRANYFRQSTDNAITARITDLRDTVDDYVEPDHGADPPDVPVLHTPVLEADATCEGRQVSLWVDADPSFTGITIYRYDRLNPLGVLVLDDGPVPTEADPFVDAPLIVGVEYAYRAFATSAGGTSELSAQIEVTPCLVEACDCGDWEPISDPQDRTGTWTRVGCL